MFYSNIPEKEADDGRVNVDELGIGTEIVAVAPKIQRKNKKMGEKMGVEAKKIASMPILL